MVNKICNFKFNYLLLKGGIFVARFNNLKGIAEKFLLLTSYMYVEKAV